MRGPFADLRSARRRGERQSHGPLQLAERVLEASRPKRLWRECGLGVTVAEDQDAAQELVEPEATSAEPAEPAEPAGSADRARLRRRFRRRRNRKLQRLEASMEEMLPPEIGVEERKKRVLMLISDTGGGHRASAQAMESMLEQVAPGATDVRIVDVWTQYCPFPFNNFVKSYQYMAKHPWMWGVSWYATAVSQRSSPRNGKRRRTPHAARSRASAFAGCAAGRPLTRLARASHAAGAALDVPPRHLLARALLARLPALPGRARPGPRRLGAPAHPIPAAAPPREEGCAEARLASPGLASPCLAAAN